MKFQCAIGGHSATSDPVYNSGYYFTACRRCGRHLLRSARGDWRTAPAGHRIVWKAGRHSHSLEADYAGLLPIAGPASALPATPRPRARHRWLVPVRPPRPARAGGPAAEEAEESGDYPYPRLLLTAVILGAGLKLLFGFASGR